MPGAAPASPQHASVQQLCVQSAKLNEVSLKVRNLKRISIPEKGARQETMPTKELPLKSSNPTKRTEEEGLCFTAQRLPFQGRQMLAVFHHHLVRRRNEFLESRGLEVRPLA